MEGGMIDLAKYRLKRAEEDLETSEDNCRNGKYRASVNRSYYAIFHALRAVAALDQFDSRKHSGIIAYVNQHFVKTGVFDKSFSKKVDMAFRLREKADYDDFYVVSAEEAKSQIERARSVLKSVEAYLTATNADRRDAKLTVEGGKENEDNSLTSAIKMFQFEMVGEAERTGLNSEEAITALVGQMRSEDGEVAEKKVTDGGIDK